MKWLSPIIKAISFRPTKKEGSAKEVIAYKQKISEQWLEKSTNDFNESDNEVDEDTIKYKIKK